jgi:uncharacterized membrane protein
LGKRKLEAGYVRDKTGTLRVIFPTPTWEDYLTLAFDEIRHYGATSMQVMRRLRSAVYDLAEAVPVPEHRLAVQNCIQLSFGYSRSKGRKSQPSSPDIENQSPGKSATFSDHGIIPIRSSL